MGLLRKKKKEEEVLEVVEEEKTAKTPSKKSSRKSKPKPKEWGKKERLVLLFVFLLTVGSSGILALKSRSWKLPGFPRIALPKLNSISFWDSDTITIEGNKNNLNKKEIVVDGFNNISKKLTGVYGLYVIQLEDGYSFGVNENEIFEPASLNKLPVIAAAYRASEEGNLNLTDKYTLKSSDKVGGSGILQSRENGSIYTYQELLDLMGKQSDNTAFAVMRKTVGEEKIAKTITELGLGNTSINDNQTTPRDIGTYFERIYRGYLSDSSKDAIFASITNTVYENYLPAGLPGDIRIAHKYGREVHVINDAGIVFTEKPYIIVIMSKGIVDSEGDIAIPEISKLVFDAETRN